MSALYPPHYNHIELNNSHLSYTWFTGVRKDVDFESGKVLLSNIGGKIQATSAFCSHYGAPLSSNVHSCPKHLASLVPVDIGRGDYLSCEEQEQPKVKTG